VYDLFSSLTSCLRGRRKWYRARSLVSLGHTVLSLVQIASSRCICEDLPNAGIERPAYPPGALSPAGPAPTSSSPNTDQCRNADEVG
jgi:hypothetical protein